MQAIVNLFAILTILGALAKGIASALHNFKSKGHAELADATDRVVERGLLRPFGWIETFSQMVVTNIIVVPRREFVYTIYFAFAIVVFVKLPDPADLAFAALFIACFIVRIVSTYNRERTMRRVFLGEVQS